MNFKIDTRTRALLLCGPIGCCLFVISAIVQGAARENYSAFRFPISSLSIGDSGWIQSLNFILSGGLIFLFSFGLGKSISSLKNAVWISRLIGSVGLGLAAAGLFRTDPLFGYPVSEPMALSEFTVHGRLHELVSLFVFIGLPIASFKFRNRFRQAGDHGWATYSLVSGIGMLISFILAGIGFKQVTGLVEIAGALQRLSIMIGFTWITLLSIHILRARV